MNKTTYTYSIVRYVHDPTTGEMLNVGVLLYAPRLPYFGFRLEERFKRLSEAFAGFDGEQYRRTLRQFEQALASLWKNLTGGIPGMFDLPSDVGHLASQVWPDPDLNFRLGVTLAGVTDSPEQTLEAIFQSMVLDQYERPSVERRTDEDLWASYARSLPSNVKQKLQEITLETEDYALQFSHAFRNGQWHLLQPVTLDYRQVESIQEKAARWLGRATLLRDHSEVAKLYLLLGTPQQEEYLRAYTRAKNILHKIPLRHELIEENEAPDFAQYLLDYMREHNLLSQEESATKKLVR